MSDEIEATDEMTMKIDGDQVEVEITREDRKHASAEIKADGMEFIVCDDSTTAGAMARERWEDMARHDRSEFACIIGEKRLVQWALGESDEFGISSLGKFLDVVEAHPEEDLAGYDSHERTVTDASAALVDALGFTPTVAYRTN